MMHGDGTLINFLALSAWREGADCIVVSAADLRRYFSIDRLSDVRVRELIATAKPLFPFAERAWENPLQHANVSIFLFRRPLPPEPFTPERMAERDRIGFLNLAVATTRFDIPEREHMEEVLAYLRGSNVFGTFDPRPEAALFRRPSSRVTRSSPRRR